MLLAAQSMAVGTVLVRYVTKHADPIMATGYHMLLGGLPLLLLSYQQEAATLAERLPQLTGELFSPYNSFGASSVLGSNPLHTAFLGVCGDGYISCSFRGLSAERKATAIPTPRSAQFARSNTSCHFDGKT